MSSRSSRRMPPTLRPATRISLGHLTCASTPPSRRAVHKTQPASTDKSPPHAGGGTGRRQAVKRLPGSEIQDRRNCPRPAHCEDASTESQTIRRPLWARCMATSSTDEHGPHRWRLCVERASPRPPSAPSRTDAPGHSGENSSVTPEIAGTQNNGMRSSRRDGN